MSSYHDIHFQPCNKVYSKSTLNQGREDPSCTRGHGSVDTGDNQHHADFVDADFDLCQHQTSYDCHADADAGQIYRVIQSNCDE